VLTVRIPVPDPDAVLAAFGAGALARLESAAAEGGAYAEAGTAAVVSGLNALYIVDATANIWHRHRFSAAAPADPADYGEYSAPSRASAILTVAEFREHLVTRLSDDALQGLLDAAADAIADRAGQIGSVTDVRTGGGPTVALSRRIGAMASVSEQWLPRTDPAAVSGAVLAGEFWGSATTLDPDDYLVSADGRSVQRLATGPNPAEAWGQAVRLEYAAFDDTAERARVQIALVRLDIAHSPGLAAQSVLGASEQYAAGTYAQQREDILSTLPGRRRWGFA
jgi:hypothetical protein